MPESWKDLARLGHRRLAEPASHKSWRCLDRQRHQGARDVGTRHHRRGRVDEEHSTGCGVVVQDLQGLHVAFHRRVADDVHRVAVRPVGRQHPVQPLERDVVQGGQRDARMRRSVGRHYARAAAVGQDREGFRPIGPESSQCFGRQKQLLKRVYAQHAGARDGCVVDHVRARQRAGVRGCGALALVGTPGLDDDHRLVARRRARRRHELARRLDGFDVQEDGACLRVTG